ncbi:uncharacterized protein G2W53_040032 [Senna tora]|uniref:Uncharacterized protein n=1 Tax=Senna tora TaxID=362788 RepID=A0A834SQU7_9FABA|nr:uncharacterized protein G2W53_040032 [Senna tora]
MHVRFCLEKKLTHDSLIFDGRRSTWSTAGRPTRMALKLLGRLPCVIGIILTQHMHVRFCLEKKLTHGLHFDPSHAREILPRKKFDPWVIDFGWTAIPVVDHRATDSDGLETSWEASLCHRDHFDSAYAREILPRKKVDPWVIDFGWTAIHAVDRRATDSDGLETSWEASLCHRDQFDSAYAPEILPRKKVDPWVIDFGWTAIQVASIEDLAARKSDCLETSWEVSLCHRLHFDPSHAREILPRKKS